MQPKEYVPNIKGWFEKKKKKKERKKVRKKECKKFDDEKFVPNKKGVIETNK